MVNVGYYNYIASGRIICITSPFSKPTRHLIREARNNGHLIDLTMGKRTRSVIVMDNNHIVLAANMPKTIVDRLTKKNLVLTDQDSAP